MSELALLISLFNFVLAFVLLKGRSQLVFKLNVELLINLS